MPRMLDTAKRNLDHVIETYLEARGNMTYNYLRPESGWRLIVLPISLFVFINI
jgi:hypothetical protein